MPKRKKPSSPPSQLKQFADYSLFSIPVSSWLFIGSIFALSAALYYLLVLREYSAPTIETFAAEVTNVWTQPYESDTGGGVTYWVALTRDDQEMKCTIPRILIHLWRELEMGHDYEFEVSITRSKCFINAVTPLEDTSF